jgi:5,10-methylene-tetrahydrofolate dehydrogenase/methenyl tetrahydrofolate cyclohydrolase
LQGDILVAALGRPEFVKADMVKEGAIVIDVGITRVDDATAKKGFRIKGDVAFAEVAPKNFGHHSCARRRWTNDDCRSVEKYDAGV